jgi:hypothetical protein
MFFNIRKLKFNRVQQIQIFPFVVTLEPWFECLTNKKKMGGFTSNFHTEYAVIDVVWINELNRSTAQESNPSVPAEVTLLSSRNGLTNCVIVAFGRN